MEESKVESVIGSFKAIEERKDLLESADNIAIELLDPKITDEWVALNNACKAFFFSLEGKGLDELLYTREFAEKYQLLHKDLNQKFQKQIEALAAYNEVHNLSFITDFAARLSARYQLWAALESIHEGFFAQCEEKLKDIKQAVIEDFKEYSKRNEKDAMRELKDKAKEFKLSRDELFTPKIWANMIKIEDKAAELAIEGVLEHAKEEDFSQMDASWRSSLTENAGLLQRMQSVCRDEELFDFDYANGSHIRLFDVLSTKNKVLFYKLVLRRNLIQCEMFPGLKEPYIKWLRDGQGQTFVLSEEQKKQAECMLHWMANCKWKLPATYSNVQLLVSTLLGLDDKRIDDIDRPFVAMLWDAIEHVRGGNGTAVVCQNLLGLLLKRDLLKGEIKTLCTEIFGDTNAVNNINKGVTEDLSQRMKLTIPFINTYIDKIIMVG